MATTKTQRWGILAILIVTVIGTVGSFAVMVLASKNQSADASKTEQARNNYMTAYKAYQAKVDAQAAELSAQYYATFSPYTSRVSTFDASTVKSLSTEDVLVGDGEEITGTTKFAAYYIGWNPKGKIFDQSIDGDKLKAPIAIDNGLDAAGLIPGWKEGMKGMKLGGVRVLTIPSDKAYGESGQGDTIPPNTPLRFVVMAIPAPEAIPQPEVPAELYQNIQ
jgi:FKBP-type peptidyl-prolyl cis-trans isomerase FkpA